MVGVDSTSEMTTSLLSRSVPIPQGVTMTAGAYQLVITLPTSSGSQGDLLGSATGAKSPAAVLALASWTFSGVTSLSSSGTLFAASPLPKYSVPGPALLRSKMSWPNWPLARSNLKLLGVQLAVAAAWTNT